MGDAYKMLRVTTLKLPNQAEAQKLLDKVAWQVQPIMRKHKWTVPVLAEFLPKSGGLLGLNRNRGQKIQVRLRQDKSGPLMPYESALGTTLHELCHNVHGAHGAPFYKLLDELRDECDALEDKGKGGAGDGFDAVGIKLTGTSRNPASQREGRLKALAAAEKRCQQQQLCGSAPQRLGGRRPAAVLPPAQMVRVLGIAARLRRCSFQLRVR